MRYYNSSSGRFISEDPIGFNGEDLNLYRYVGNSVHNLIDPSGEAAFPVVGVITVPIMIYFIYQYFEDDECLSSNIYENFILNEWLKQLERKYPVKRRRDTKPPIKIPDSKKDIFKRKIKFFDRNQKDVV